MKCFNHNTKDAIGVCAHCGRGLCLECIPPSPARRLTCSAECSTGISANSTALQLLLEKSRQSAQANAFYCYLTGGLSAAAAFGAWFMLPSPFLIYFTGGCSIALFAAGVWHARAGRTKAAQQRGVS
jgi:hypothetical protein